VLKEPAVHHTTWEKLPPNISEEEARDQCLHGRMLLCRSPDSSSRIVGDTKERHLAVAPGLSLPRRIRADDEVDELQGVLRLPFAPDNGLHTAGGPCTAHVGRDHGEAAANELSLPWPQQEIPGLTSVQKLSEGPAQLKGAPVPRSVHHRGNGKQRPIGPLRARRQKDVDRYPDSI